MTLENNTLLIGQKPVMNYVLVGLTHLQGESDTLIIKARGRCISSAVDVSQILTRKFAKDVSIKGVKLDTETLVNKITSRDNRVSSIEITLQK